jgi:hypothetical protein
VSMKQRLNLRRGGPDILTEELVNVVGAGGEFEFKALFTVVYGNLRARNAAHGGEEMLRLRLYDKLQWLVQMGGVNKAGKSYCGNPAKLRPILDQVAEKHCRNLLKAVACATPEGEVRVETEAVPSAWRN